jgi:pyrroloquinoline quinone biosynthesis protein E
MVIAPGQLLQIRRGHAPNCSGSGVVVGVALFGATLAAAIANAYAARLTRAPSEARVRPEADGGATVALPADPDAPEVEARDAARIRVEGDVARALLIAGALAHGSAEAVPAPDEVHVAFTDRCPVACHDCYLDAGPDKAGDANGWEDDVAAMASMGAFEVAIGGGDPGPLPDLEARLDRLAAIGVLPNLTTSGFGVTEARARGLAGRVGQVNVSLDGLHEDYEAARGFDGRAVALRAIDRLVAAGVRVGVNTVITRFNAESLDAMAEVLAARGVAEWQLLRLKPVGRARSRYEALRAPPEALDGLWPVVARILANGRLAVRLDCALMPFLSAHDPDPAAMVLLGGLGCTGGREIWARMADGRMLPCSFSADIAEGTVPGRWGDDPELARWRAPVTAQPCRDCALVATCRGGCHVVAAARVGDAFAPDPECPRVRAWGGVA